MISASYIVYRMPVPRCNRSEPDPYGQNWPIQRQARLRIPRHRMTPAAGWIEKPQAVAPCGNFSRCHLPHCRSLPSESPGKGGPGPSPRQCVECAVSSWFSQACERLSALFGSWRNALPKTPREAMLAALWSRSGSVYRIDLENLFAMVQQGKVSRLSGSHESIR